jgi:hypothetical protein
MTGTPDHQATCPFGDPACNATPDRLTYVADYAPPGCGYAARCEACGAVFTVVGGAVYDPGDDGHIRERGE